MVSHRFAKNNVKPSLRVALFPFDRIFVSSPEAKFKLFWSVFFFESTVDMHLTARVLSSNNPGNALGEKTLGI